jgi:hypothetical protein
MEITRPSLEGKSTGTKIIFWARKKKKQNVKKTIQIIKRTKNLPVKAATNKIDATI